MHTANDLIKQYYNAFNQQDINALLNCLSDDVIHDINQGACQKGKDAFAQFMDHMNLCYNEKISSLVIMTNEESSNAAAEFIVEGIYLATDKGFPEAKKQHYQLSVGAFFNIKNNKITRITTYYNIQDWKNQINK